jgi:membrane-bound ClpP family serine protease
VRRYWLHQANLGMNQFVIRKLVGGEAGSDVAPLILDEWANTASAGSIIAFHAHNADFQPGELGVICSFGAGYSIGSVVLIQFPEAAEAADAGEADEADEAPGCSASRSDAASLAASSGGGRPMRSMASSPISSS